jgi:hypothetical protein
MHQIEANPTHSLVKVGSQSLWVHTPGPHVCRASQETQAPELEVVLVLPAGLLPGITWEMMYSVS